MTSVHVNGVKVSFLVVQLSTIADARDATVVPLASSEAIEEQAPDDVEDTIEEVWDVRDLHRSSGHDSSALERVKSLCESFLFPELDTVLKAQQWIGDYIQAFPDQPRLDASAKTNDTDSPAAQKAWKQNTVTYGK